MNAIDYSVIRPASELLPPNSAPPECSICRDSETNETDRKTYCVRNQMVGHLAYSSGASHFFHLHCIEKFHGPTIFGTTTRQDCPECRAELDLPSFDHNRSFLDRGWLQIKKGWLETKRATQNVAQTIFHGIFATEAVYILQRVLPTRVQFFQLDYFLYPFLNLGLLGLSEALVNRNLVATAVAAIAMERLHSLFADTPIPNTADLLDYPFTQLVARIVAWYPTILASPALANYAKGILRNGIPVGSQNTARVELENTPPTLLDAQRDANIIVNVSIPSNLFLWFLSEYRNAGNIAEDLLDNISSVIADRLLLP